MAKSVKINLLFNPHESAMEENRIYNINIASLEVLPTPGDIKAALPLSARAEKTVFEARLTVEQILDRRDPRLLVVVGPCSVHDPVAAMDYAHRLKRLAGELGDTMFVVMRVYFEKPRTTTGWKGMINDPHMDDSFEIEEGLKKARTLLLDIAELGLAAGTEALDPMSPQYLSDLISWSAIGARTTESQTHREMASGLSMPVGFKNGTDGALQVAINAMLSARNGHSFLGINNRGQVAVVRTKGNTYGHMILRGGSKPNYDAASIALAEAALTKEKLPNNIVIDCSHANSSRDPSRQPQVLDDVVKQMVDGNKSIVGVMLESNIHAGNQAIPEDLSLLRYGISVTDGCIDWPTTEASLRSVKAALWTVLPTR